MTHVKRPHGQGVFIKIADPVTQGTFFLVTFKNPCNSEESMGHIKYTLLCLLLLSKMCLSRVLEFKGAVCLHVLVSRKRLRLCVFVILFCALASHGIVCPFFLPRDVWVLYVLQEVLRTLNVYDSFF